LYGYRNNVWASLIAALEEGYPVTRQVLGERFFAALAHDHARQNLPDSPLMMDYGRGLSETLRRTLTQLAESGQAAAENLPFYAVDLASIELGRREAYNAADAQALVPEQLSQLAPEDVMALRLSPHPAARLLTLEHAALDVWLRHQHPEPTLAGIELARVQFLLITRPVLDVQLTELSADGAWLLEALMTGETLEEAAASLLGAYPDAELGQLLAPLLSAGVFMTPESAR
jgi:hypothetical protein